MKSWIAGKHTLHHLLNVLWEFAISFQAWHNLMQEGARGKRELPECGPKWTPPIETMSKGLTGHLVCVGQRLIQSFEYVQNVVLKTWQYFSNSIKKMQHENPVECWLNNHSNKAFCQHYIKKSTWCKTCSHLGTSRWQHTTLQNALKSFLLCRWQADEATMFSFVRNGL